MRVWQNLCLGALLLTTGLAQAQSAVSTNSTSIWQDQIGSGFRADTWEVGVAGGVGFGIKALGSTQAHDLALGNLHAGWNFTDVVARDSFLAGNWQLRGELFGGRQFRPEGAYVAMFTPGVRYNFATGSRWVPFVGVGAGVAMTDLGRPDLSTVFQFNLQAGFGVHYFFTRAFALSLEDRYLHMSNARIKSPNLGVNSNLIMLGADWYF